jgi:hypothetical protein
MTSEQITSADGLQPPLISAVRHIKMNTKPQSVNLSELRAGF